MTMGSNCNVEIMPPKTNTPNINTGSNPIFNIDLSKGFFNAPSGSTESTPLALTKSNNASHHPPPMLKIELANSALNYSTPPASSSSSITEQPSPPVIRNDVCNTPVIKIDYSKIVTAFTPLSSPEMNINTPPPIPQSSSSSAASSTFMPRSSVTASTSFAATAAATYYPPVQQPQQKPQTSTSVNIDFSTFNSSLMKTANTIYPPQPPSQSASNLDMDEDYDNI